MSMRGHMSRVMTGCFWVGVTAGCVSTAPRDVSLPSPATDWRTDWQSPASSMARLTHSDLLRADVFTTTEAVTRLRPRFLFGVSRQPVVGRPEVGVYIDGLYAGD